MNETELQAFLDRPFTATVSTVSPRGTVHSVPVWFRYGEGVFTVWTDSARRWVRHLAKNSNATVVVAEHQAPFAAVVVHGMGEVTIDEAGTDEAIRRIVERYLPADQVDAYLKVWSSLRTIVRIRPTLIRSWSRGY